MNIQAARYIVGFSILGLVISMIISGLNVYSASRAYAPDGDSQWHLVPILPVLSVMLGILLSLLFITGGLFTKRLRQPALAAAGFVATTAIGLVVFPDGDHHRIKAMKTIAANAEPIIVACEAFSSERGRPPQSLEELAPRYLTAVPETGIAAYPRYNFVSGEEAVKQFHGNPWAIYVRTPTGGIDFSIFYYCPSEEYPTEAHGGRSERIGNWSYVNE